MSSGGTPVDTIGTRAHMGHTMAPNGTPWHHCTPWPPLQSNAHIATPMAPQALRGTSQWHNMAHRGTQMAHKGTSWGNLAQPGTQGGTPWHPMAPHDTIALHGNPSTFQGTQGQSHGTTGPSWDQGTSGHTRAHHDTPWNPRTPLHSRAPHSDTATQQAALTKRQVTVDGELNIYVQFPVNRISLDLWVLL